MVVPLKLISNADPVTELQVDRVATRSPWALSGWPGGL